MKRLVPLLCLAACGPLEPMEAEDLASSTQPITNANPRSELTFGGALVELAGGDCSGAFVARDLVLTHVRCLASARVWVNGQKYSVKLARRVPFSAELAALQLKQQVPVTTVLSGSSTRVASGEALSCFGFDGSRRFGSGAFRVTDLSADTIYLRGGVAFGGSFGVERSDDGGFCTRDTTAEIVAVLASNGGPTPRAVQVDQLASWLTNVMVAVGQSRSQASLTIVDNPNSVTPTVLAENNGALSLQRRVAQSPQQAFYFAPVMPGRPELIALVSASTGTCVEVRTLPTIPPFPPLTTARLARCNFTSSAQWFVQTSFPNVFGPNLTTGYTLEAPTSPGTCLFPLTGSTLVDCRGAKVGYWLNLF